MLWAIIPANLLLTFNYSMQLRLREDCEICLLGARKLYRIYFRMSVVISYDGQRKGWCSGYDVLWCLVDDLFAKYAWVEFYPNQQRQWLARMSCPTNHGKRVWVHPFEGVSEIRYEYYLGNSHSLRSWSDFVVIADFDNFISEFLSRVNVRTNVSNSQ